DAAVRALEQVARIGAPLAVSTATSLLHVPHDTADETQLPAELLDRLAFADQKVGEVVTLARFLTEGRDGIAEELAASDRAKARWASVPGVRVPAVRERLATIGAADRTRMPYPERLAAQSGLGLPVLPTTTIGSFPQTDEIRRARSR